MTAATLSDMLAARDALGERAETHAFTAVAERHPGIGEISWSLDAFLVDGALRCRHQLPAFAGSCEPSESTDHDSTSCPWCTS